MIEEEVAMATSVVIEAQVIYRQRLSWRGYMESSDMKIYGKYIWIWMDLAVLR
jgi:hypothetical protein